LFYLLTLTLILTVIMVFQSTKENGINKYLIILVASYFTALTSMIIYISKDTYYYNLIKDYFYLPDFIWRTFFFVSISKMNLIRIMNFSSIAIVIISTYFAFSFFTPDSRTLQKGCKITLWCYASLQFLIYDPFLNLKAYYFLYPEYLSVKKYLHTEQLIYTFTHILNIVIVLLNLLLLVYALRYAPKLKLFRLNYIFLALGYASLSFVYVYFISATPAFYMKISKISGTYSFRSIQLGSSTFIYRMLPYISIPTILILTYCVYKLTRLNNQAQLEELYISKEISSSETTSKIFCHYIKNEILAIQSEVDMLPKSEASNDIVNDLLKRCQTLYGRIDEIHRSTKTSQLNLKPYSIQDLLNQTLDIFTYDLENTNVDLHFPKSPVTALIDPVYMEQALHNIIKNALDAMENLPDDRKSLNITLTSSNSWGQILIKDSGKGISKENLDKIFLPFYSSHSYSQHWGIGLTLTYKIILAHEGKITAESTPMEGTAISILLPLLKSVKSCERGTEHESTN